MLANATIPESTLKKKSASVAYYLIRGGVDMDDWRKTYVNADDNKSDLLIKALYFGEKRHRFMKKVLMRIYGSSCIGSGIRHSDARM